LSPDEHAASLVGLVAAGVLDAGLAGLVSLLLEDGIPVHVAGRVPDDAGALLDALVSALPSERRPGAGGGGPGHRLVRVPGPLSAASPSGTLRAALAATTGRSGLASTIQADDLGGVLAIFREQRLSDDEISFMGVVLILGSDHHTDGRVSLAPSRVVAAHYLRPVARDAGGHVQRLGPAVLATWDPERSRYDHFAWGIYPELAARTGLRAGDVEREHVVRAGALLPPAQPDEV
jgi:hypothetical protein